MTDTSEVEPQTAAPAGQLDLPSIARTWWPLALSWLLMGAEQPALSATMARLAEPEVNLAAFGGIVFPLALLVEAPIIMLLAASTALARDSASFEKLARFTFRAGLGLTLVHAALAFTPLYDALLVPLLRPDPRTVEPGRMGLRILTFWTWAIADRRFRQGLLIRFGHSRAVGLGTIVRLVTTASALLVGALAGFSGIVVASSALALGVTVEMVYARWASGPLVRGELRAQPPIAAPLTRGRFLAFYVPLAMTPVLVLSAQPIGAAAINRMPEALVSLAAWPVLVGLVFLTRTAGMAFNEVVVRHAGDPGSRTVLVRFAWILAGCGSGVLALVAATPLWRLWFETLCGLEPELARTAHAALWLAIPMPALTVAHSLYQGVLVDAHRTRGVTEAVGLYLVVSSAALGFGVLTQYTEGASAATLAFTIGQCAQLAWLRHRARGHDRSLLPGAGDARRRTAVP